MDVEKDLINLYRQQQEKFVYYILALNVTCIGFSIIKTSGQPIKWLQLPLAGAVLCWSISIFCGLTFLKYAISGLYNNKMFLDLLQGENPEVGKDRDMIAAAASGALQAMEKNSNCANNLMKWQGRLFYFGILSFMAWHVCEMICK